MSPDEAIEIRKLGRAEIDPLLRFLLTIESAGEAALFKPHPFSREALEGFCSRTSRDLYYVLIAGVEVLGYGLLRGWDEGYAVPSLGIAIHADHRGSGLAGALMEFLHAVARHRGAPAVRLRVDPSNARAIALYQRSGYRFAEPADMSSGKLLVGTRQLDR